jgi:hypothetical protein
MGLDVRLPIGSMFAILGALLAGSGAFGADGSRLNLWCGIMLLVFGAVMLWLGRRGTSSMRPSSQSPEGQAIEVAEQARRVERGNDE